MKGFFLVVEGIDGAGKTTLCELLKNSLRSRGYDVLLTREPTEGKYGKELKRRITEGKITPEEELELFLKDREEHVKKVLEPSLRSGKLVISDRYYFSSCAYQGARGLDYQKICQANSSFPSPDFVILLDIDPSVALRRKKAREEHFEEEVYLKKVREIYIKVVKPFPHLIIDARRSPEEALSEALKALDKCLKK